MRIRVGTVCNPDGIGILCWREDHQVLDGHAPVPARSLWLEQPLSIQFATDPGSTCSISAMAKVDKFLAMINPDRKSQPITLYVLITECPDDIIGHSNKNRSNISQNSDTLRGCATAQQARECRVFETYKKHM